MTRHKRSGRTRASTFVIAVSLLTAHSCARVLHRPAQQPALAVMAELWQEPADLERRDLFHGAGGAVLAPPEVTYAFVARKTSGKNPGYDVRDPQGRLWSVKLGEESQSEVAVSRILWAIGFHQPPTYYVERWTLSGADAPQQGAGRFRLERPEQEAVADWSWYENPFVGSRPFAALVTVNLLLKNWDLKTSNNKIYMVTNADGVRDRRYVVRDLGGSLGEAKQPRFLSWFPFMRHQQGSKNNLEDFEAQGFVRAVNGDRVDFDYRGLDNALADGVNASELGWTCGLLARLSEDQWLDAFRAGGYTLDQSTRYVRKIQEKIAHARALLAI